MTVELAPYGPLCTDTWIKRCLMAVCAPISGTRAVGKALVKASGADTLLRGGSHAVLVLVEGNKKPIDFTRVYKVSPATPNVEGVYRCDQADVTATSAGVEVSMLAVGGGTAHNLPVGAKLMWWPPIDGMDPFLDVTEAIDGATDATLTSALTQIVGFSELGISKSDMPAQAWKAKLTKLPAAILVWHGSPQVQPYCKGTDMNTEHYQLCVFSSTWSSNDERRTDSMAALGHLQALLMDRSAVDGFSFSTPNIRVSNRGFVVADDRSYVHTIDFRVSHAVSRIDDRTFQDWNVTQQKFLTAVSAVYPDIADALTIIDLSYNMT